MFGRMMNNYYYGKSGKGDFRKEDLPTNRKDLFKATLRTRFGSLIRINLLYALIWLPAMIVIFIYVGKFYTSFSQISMYSAGFEAYADWAQSQDVTPMSEEEYNKNAEQIAVMTRDYELYSKLHGGMTQEEFTGTFADSPTYLEWLDRSIISQLLLLLFPCIAITGPFTAGLSYVTRNWARDEHSFIWTDFKDAVKENWKYSLVISSITGLLPLAAYTGWITYGQLSGQNMLMIVPQILVVMIWLIWSISVTYMYPVTVTYDLKLKDVIWGHGIVLSIARLPFSVGIRLLHCVPAVIIILIHLLFGLDLMMAVVILGVYYVLIGFSLSRFITASYTNAVFDRFINSRIEGAKVNQGLYEAEELGEEYDDDDDEESSEDGKE